MKKHRAALIQAAVLSALFILGGCAPSSTISTTPAVAPSTGPVDSSPNVPQTALAKLNAQVFAGGGIADTDIGGIIAARTENSLANRGFRIAPSAPDIRVEVAPRSELFDQSGNYYLYKGEADVAVTRAFDGKLLGKTTVRVKADRALGKDAARGNVGEALATEVATWVGQTVSPQRIGIAANDVFITTPRTRDRNAFVSNFIQALQADDAIIGVTLTGQDYATGQMTFRVVYFPDKVPEGIVNRITANPSISYR